LGDYKGVVPITLVTRQRGNIGGLSPEIAALKGIRYAVMNEPSKGDRLNDGIMKELTGEDPITGRALYSEPVTFVPQFSLVVCTNNLFDIKSNDDGTWRRIRLCEFLSKFTKTPVSDEENPYQFPIDTGIAAKFEKWKTVFAGMLADIAFKTDCVVKDCDMVLAASKEYRQGQDYLMEFTRDRIEKSDIKTDKIKKSEVYAEFKIWYTETYGKGVPKGKELYAYLDKHLGKFRGGAWSGYRIKYETDEEEEEETSFGDDYE
jgi:phage/plasmid-associated DNA primase